MDKFPDKFPFSFKEIGFYENGFILYFSIAEDTCLSMSESSYTLKKLYKISTLYKIYIENGIFFLRLNLTFFSGFEIFLYKNILLLQL